MQRVKGILHYPVLETITFCCDGNVSPTKGWYDWGRAPAELGVLGLLVALRLLGLVPVTGRPLPPGRLPFLLTGSVRLLAQQQLLKQLHNRESIKIPTIARIGYPYWGYVFNQSNPILKIFEPSHLPLRH
jgi:hypothetical protein